MKNLFKHSNLFMSFLLGVLFITTSCGNEANKDSAVGEVSVDTTTAANVEASPEATPGDKTIGEIVTSYATAEAEEDRQFTLLLAALEYAGITAMFTEAGEYTVFAPTDAAFEKFLNGNPLDSFTKEQVANVLSYHVVDGTKMSDSVLPESSPREIPTLLGPSIYVNSSAGIDTNDENMDADASILVDAGLFDIAASNGVIHVIDSVLVPATE